MLEEGTPVPPYSSLGAVRIGPSCPASLNALATAVCCPMLNTAVTERIPGVARTHRGTTAYFAARSGRPDWRTPSGDV